MRKRIQIGKGNWVWAHVVPNSLCDVFFIQCVMQRANSIRWTERFIPGFTQNKFMWYHAQMKQVLAYFETNHNIYYISPYKKFIKWRYFGVKFLVPYTKRQHFETKKKSKEKICSLIHTRVLFLIIYSSEFI